MPEPDKHPLWHEIQRILEPATDADANILDAHELVWIAFEDTTLFGAGTTALMTNGEARILACGGFKHRLWIEQALGVVSAWARDCGAKKLTMRGRMGWARYFRAFGWDCSRDGDQWAFEKAL